MDNNAGEISAAAGRARLSALSRHRRRLRNMVTALAFLALSLAGSAAAVTLFGAQTFHWRAFDIEAGIEPSMTGETRLVFAPLGEVRARTHATPVAFYARLKSVSFDDLKNLISSPPPRRELEIDFQKAARGAIRDLVIRQVMLGAAGSLVVPIFFRLRRARYWLLCALWGGGFVAAVFYSGYRSFNPAAFENPTYTGSLRQADWIITLVKDGFNKAEALSDKLRHVAANLNTLYGRIEGIPGADEPNSIRILHISDIHNNRAAVTFVRELAARTGVDAVVDTGDLTDFGSPLETSLSQGLAGLAVPYVFVPGNHDSQATIAAVSANPKHIVLNGRPVRVAGLTLLGAPDPSSARAGPGSVDTPPQALSAAAAKLRSDLDAAASGGERADVVCVHDPKQAASVVGAVPVILCGHEHRMYIETRGGTVVCNAGTTGAAGARYLDVRQGVPLSAAILTFSSAPGHRLLIIDQVTLDGSLGQYSITRRTFGPPAPMTAAPNPRETTPAVRP